MKHWAVSYHLPVLHVMHHDFHLFLMSILIFIEDNKRNECGGGSFLENLKFLKFLHSFIWYSMYDLILKPCEQQHDLFKTT